MTEISIKSGRAVQVTYFLLRVIAGLLLIQTGGLILFGWFGGMPGQPGTPSLLSQTGIGSRSSDVLLSPYKLPFPKVPKFAEIVPYLMRHRMCILITTTI
jgi:hypothetical protein